MSIKDVRFKELFDKIIKEEISKGNLPSSRTVIQRINNTLSSIDLSKPSYKFKAIDKGSITDPVQYNHNIDSIRSDASILYDRLLYSYDVFKKEQESFRIKKEKLLYQIKSLKDEIDTLVAKFDNKGINDIFFDTFYDTSKIDMSNTTALVNKNVTLKKLLNRTVLLDVSPTTTVSIETSVPKTIRPNGLIDNVFNKNNLKPVSYTIVPEQETEVYVRFKIDFSKYTTPPYSAQPNLPGILINRIEMDANVDNQIKIEYTYDNENIFDLPYYSGYRDMQRIFNFPETLISTLYITLLKTKSDHSTGSQLYEYNFSINKIQFYNLDYQESGVLQSNQFTTTSNIGKVSLSTDQENPEGTSIDYFIAINDDEWIPISSLQDTAPRHAQVVDLMNVEPSVSTIYEIPSTLSKMNQELTELKWNGINFYRLGEINGIIKNSRLYRGKNAIRINNSLKAIDENNPRLLYTGSTDAVLEFYVYSVNDTNINYTPLSEMSAEITMNNSVVHSLNPITLDTSVSYRFVRGWNKFVIKLQGSGHFDIGFNLRQYGNLYAENTPMKPVDFIELQRVVKINDHGSYAIKDNLLVVNDYIPDIEYELLYDSVIQEAHNIKLKAILNRNGAHVTPTLKSYYINII